jgi:protein tyrosine phosphatase (PTP) superfamily phosphohydrolase (DUF442 family)
MLQRVLRSIAALRIVADVPRMLARSGAALKRHGPIAAGQYLVDHSVRLMRGLPPVHFSRITPQLYVGGQYSTRGLQRLRNRGFTAIINLREEFDDAEAGISLGQYLYLPTIDDETPSMDDLCSGVRFMTDEMEKGGKIYVHCMLGVGRSVTLIAAYLVCEGMEPDVAWRFIRRRRPFIQPTAVQLAQIERLARERSCCDDGDSSGNGAVL